MRRIAGDEAGPGSPRCQARVIEPVVIGVRVRQHQPEQRGIAVDEVRDLRVTPHALTNYDALSEENPDDDDTAR